MSDTQDEGVVDKFLTEIKDRPGLRKRVLAELSLDKYVKQDEWMTVLDELKTQRELMHDHQIASNKRFEAVDKRFEAVDKRFEAVDKRFEAVDKRFEEMIDAMNKRTVTVDKRFEAVDKRFEEMIDATNKRIVAVDKRFEEIIDTMNKRTVAVDKRFEEIIDTMNKRTVAVDKRFEEIIDAMNKKFDQIIASTELQFKEMSAAIGSFTSRAGLAVEKTIIDVMRTAILEAGLSEDNVSRIEKFGIRDKEGIILPVNAKIQFDGIIRNDTPILLEIKFHPTADDVYMFLNKARAFAKYEGVEPELWLVAVEIQESVMECAERQDVKVVHSRLVRY